MGSLYVLYVELKVHVDLHVRLAATSLYRPAVWHVFTHFLVGSMSGSPKYPESTKEAGQISIQTLVISYANVGEGHEAIHFLVRL